MEKVTTSDNVRHHGVLVCKHCKTLWQRDVLASKNLFWIAKSVIAGYGRPFPFLRPTQDTSTASSTSTSSDVNQRTIQPISTSLDILVTATNAGSLAREI